MNVDGGDDRLTAHPDVLIQNGFSSFRCQTETRSNLPNLADTICHVQPPPRSAVPHAYLQTFNGRKMQALTAASWLTAVR